MSWNGSGSWGRSAVACPKNSRIIGCICNSNPVIECKDSWINENFECVVESHGMADVRA